VSHIVGISKKQVNLHLNFR